MASFLAPIQQAASVLANCKITGSKGYRSPAPGDVHHWALCNGAGVTVRTRYDVEPKTTFHFYAAMSWRLIEDDRDGYGPYRVTATRYDYSLTTAEGAELWALHWHPDGKSDVTYPHAHIGDRVLDSEATLTSKAHLPTGRMTFESAVRWVIEFGGAPAVNDWEDRLALAEAPHLLYRSWTQDRERESERRR